MHTVYVTMYIRDKLPGGSCLAKMKKKKMNVISSVCINCSVSVSWLHPLSDCRVWEVIFLYQHVT